MSLSLTAFFNLRLAHIAPLGYAKAISFSQPSWNVPPSQRIVRPEKRRFVSGAGMAARVQRQRRVLVEDCELTEEQLRKRQKNLRYRAKLAKRRSPAFFQQAKAQLSMLMIMEES
jgi:hypothetical protein